MTLLTTSIISCGIQDHPQKSPINNVYTTHHILDRHHYRPVALTCVLPLAPFILQKWLPRIKDNTRKGMPLSG